MKESPKPRQLRNSQTTYGKNGTWLEPEEMCIISGTMKRRAYVICEDGKKRVVDCFLPDSFFSIPANAKINGKRHYGFIHLKDEAFHFTEDAS